MIITIAILYPILTAISIYFIVRFNHKNLDEVVKLIVSLTNNADSYIKVDAYNRAQIMNERKKKNIKKDKEEDMSGAIF